jgi:hypothetical protein
MWKRFILWDYPRGSRPYDIIVGLILAFIFLTPRAWFRDIPKASNVAMVSSESGSAVYFVDAELLARIPEGERIPKLTEILRKRTNDRRLTITRVEPIPDSEGELRGYMAFARP